MIRSLNKCKWKIYFININFKFILCYFQIFDKMMYKTAFNQICNLINVLLNMIYEKSYFTKFFN